MKLNTEDVQNINDINHRMEDHLQTKWFFNRGLDTKISLEYPQHLQGEINYYLNKEVLDLPVFGALNDNFVKQLGYGITTQFAGRIIISLFMINYHHRTFKYSQVLTNASSIKMTRSMLFSTSRVAQWK